MGLSGAGDVTIQGFTTDISVNAGGMMSFKISTPAKSYHVDIYRLGYYQGQGGRLITTIQPSATLPQTQPACLTDSATLLDDCGNWAVSASWQVPATAISGLYLAVPTRDDTGGASYIPFIVRNDGRISDVLFQTSDETWAAYNPYGGHSLYGDTGFNLNARAYKVSYNRPIWTRSLEDATFLFNAEYPMIRWLERNGYDVSYFTDVDAVRNASLITNHKVYLSVGHDEYWSGPRRANVQAALAAGVNLAFFSGNEVFWKTRWEDSIDGTNTPYRTLVCYKETYFGTPTLYQKDPLDPTTWTGTWADPRFSPPADGGLPQNALTGTLFKVNGPGADNTTLAISVPAQYAPLRFWRNTSIASLSSGQTATLPAGTLGYEWDADVDNGFRPAGLFDLSSSTFTMTSDLLLDFGGTYGAGPVTHSLTLYRAPSGALVFGAGTVQWAWGLDNNHDGASAPIDIRMQQATANLFADMGVQAYTLQSNLVTPLQSTDNVPPSSTIQFPSPGVTIPSGSLVTITGTAVDAGGGVVAAVEVSTDGGVTWHRATGLQNWTYAWTALSSGAVTLLSRAVDDSANLEIPGAGVTVNVPAPLISPDASVSKDAPAAASNIAAPAISTATSKELLLAFIAADYLAGPNTTVTGVTGGGLTWALVTRTNSQNGTAEIWRAFAPNPLSNVIVTATLSQSVISSITVKSFAGVDSSGSNGSGAIGATGSGHASAGEPTASLTTTRNGSWVFGVGNDLSNAVARTPGPGQTLIHQYLAAATGDTYWVQMENAPTLTSGTTVTLNDIEPITDSYNLAICEILPTAGSGHGISGAITPSSIGNGVTVTLTGPTNTIATADTSGNFTAANLANGTYTLTPNKAGYAFTPGSQTVMLNGVDVFGVNFTGAALPTFSVSGTIAGGGGATVTITPTGESGTNTTVTADSSGNFIFTQVVSGGYTVTPAKSGSTFTPGNQTITVNGNVTGVNFTATVVGFSISGTVSPTAAGSGATVTLSGAASATVTADGSGNYSFGGLLNGTYTVTPAKSGYTFAPTSLPVTVSNSNVSGVSFSGIVQGGGTSNLVIDATAFKDNSTASATIATSTFSTNSANELLLALVATDGVAANMTVTSMTGGGLTWTLVQRTNSQGGTAEIWRAFAIGLLTNVSVTANLAQSRTASIEVLSFTGADATGTNGSGAIGATTSASGTSGAQSASLTTTRNNSWVFGVGNDYDKATARTLGPNQTLVHQYLSPSGDTYWMQRQSATTAASGTAVTINDTAPTGDHFNLSIVEIKPAVASSPTYTISGTVAPTAGGTGTVLTLSGASSATVTADSSGNYSFANLADGSYTVTPAKTGYTFSPASQTITVGGANVSGVNFTATPIPTYTISGTVSPAATGAGAVLTLSGTASGTATADGSGNYSFANLANGSYTVTPAKTGYTFTPASQTVTVNGADVPGMNFTATPIPTYTISGTINPAATGPGTVLTLSGKASGTATADSSGNYSFSNLANGSYTVTPTKTGYTFSPVNQPVTVNGANAPSINFTATPIPTYTISGTVSPATTGTGTVLTLSGAASGTATADGSGNYSFANLANGTYTVTPAKAGLTFTPTNQAVTVSGANASGVNFTGATAPALTRDAGVSKDNNTASTTIVSPALSTTSGSELLLALVSTDYISGTNTTVSSISGGGLTWFLVARSNTQSGTSEIWRAFASAPLLNVAFTATLSQSVGSTMTVLSFAGVDTSGTNGSGAIGATKTANGKSGAPTASVVTTRNNSLVLGVGNDFDKALARTPGASQSLVHQLLSTAGDTYWVQTQNNPTPLSGTTVTINDTAPTTDRYNLVICEILPHP